jgi:hypothetical protein
MAYTGPSFMDIGYFYCPYVPLSITPSLLIANDGTIHLQVSQPLKETVNWLKEGF